jgi:hypothetical protein
MMAPGDDYSWYAPLAQTDDEIGDHREAYSALNVPNPQPGFHYYWCHYHKGSNYSEITSFMNEGWQPVLAGEPEFQNKHRVNFLQSQQNVDNLKIFGDVCLMKIDLDRYREIQDTNTRAANQQLYGQADAHIDRGEEMGRRFGRNTPKGKHLYYARADHNINSEVFDPNAANTKD